MKLIVVISAIVLVALLWGCAANSQLSQDDNKLTEILTGIWQEADGTIYDIQPVKKKIRIVSIKDTDGELFEIIKSGLKKDVLKWTYYVPSTKYTVKMETTSITEHEIHCLWKNAYSSGTEVLTKIDSVPPKSKKIAQPGI